MMKAMPTGGHRKWELREDTGLFGPRRCEKKFSRMHRSEILPEAETAMLY